jgi:hypothetical protein
MTPQKATPGMDAGSVVAAPRNGLASTVILFINFPPDRCSPLEGPTTASA